MREEKDRAHTRARVLADSSLDTHLCGEKSHGAQRVSCAAGRRRRKVRTSAGFGLIHAPYGNGA